MHKTLIELMKHKVDTSWEVLIPEQVHPLMKDTSPHQLCVL